MRISDWSSDVCSSDLRRARGPDGDCRYQAQGFISSGRWGKAPLCHPTETRPQELREPMSTLVLVRHGKTEWSSQNRFAGWADAPLSAAGRQEAQGAGRVLAAAGYRFELACTSYLSRAAETLDIILEELGRPTPPVERSWRLNERHYGVLQGDRKSTRLNSSH